VIKRIIPIIDHLKAYNVKKLSKDVRAGINVALLDFPQSMAYAMIAGLPIQMGVFTSAIGSITAPLFASSRFLIAGPSNATAVLLMSGFLSLNVSESDRLRILPVILIMVAMFLFLGRLLKVEIIIQYISRAVISGYITAAAFLIIINQLKYLIGLDIPKSSTFLESLNLTVANLGQTDWRVLLFSSVTFALYLGYKHFAKSLPALALTVISSALMYVAISKTWIQPRSSAQPFCFRLATVLSRSGVDHDR
jgi:SulP family sulfate permease